MWKGNPRIFILLVVLAVVVFKISADTNSGYDLDKSNGFFIRSTDDTFRLNLGGYTQARWHLNYRIDPPSGEENTTSGFYVNRTRIYMEGHYTPKFHYKFQVNINSEGLFNLWTAKIQYDINPRWSLHSGLGKVPQSREDWISLQNTLTTDHSANDFTFATGSAYMLAAAFKGDRIHHSMGISNGNYGAKYTYPKSDSHSLGFYSRWEYQLIGHDWKIWRDLTGRKGRDFGLMLGWAAGYHVDLAAGSTSAPRNNGQANIDLSINGDGFQGLLSTVWTYAITDPADKDIYHYNSFGVMAQGGFFIAEQHQLYAQYNLISPGLDPGRFTNYNSLTLGYNFFPFVRTNRWKFSVEGAYLFNRLNETLVPTKVSLGFHDSDENGQFYFRLQTQFGF